VYLQRCAIEFLFYLWKVLHTPMLMGHWVKFCLVIGWGLILEYAMGSWSPFPGQDILIKCSKCLDKTRLTTDPASYTVIFNELTRFLIVILVISLLIKGTEKAASANNIVILKVSAVIFNIVGSINV
jgi:APA family basic amino acid/polyamine antiporter